MSSINSKLKAQLNTEHGFLLTQQMKIVFEIVNEEANNIINYNVYLYVMHKYERVCLTATMFMQITCISRCCCLYTSNTEH